MLLVKALVFSAGDIDSLGDGVGVGVGGSSSKDGVVNEVPLVTVLGGLKEEMLSAVKSVSNSILFFVLVVMGGCRQDSVREDNLGL